MNKIIWLIIGLSCGFAYAGVIEEIGTLPEEMEWDGGVIRGDVDEYLFYAQPGRELWVGISAEEDNAVFQLYGEVEGTWTALIGADEGDDTTEWQDILPDGGTGQFKIVVGSVRGNASYLLQTEFQ
jgi:hypothetical protein